MEYLNDESVNDLINFKNELEFVTDFDIKINEAIDVIDRLHKMKWKDIEEWREHIVTNYSKSELDKFTLRLIDRYCSNIEENEGTRHT